MTEYHIQQTIKSARFPGAHRARFVKTIDTDDIEKLVEQSNHDEHLTAFENQWNDKEHWVDEPTSSLFDHSREPNKR